MGTLKFCTILYAPNGTPQMAHKNIMDPGKPSVDFVRQLVHICGTSWMHHRIVPIVPRTVAATGMEDWGAMLPLVWLFPRAGRGEGVAAMACAIGLRLWVWMASGLDISAVFVPVGIVGQHGAGSAWLFTLGG